MNSRDDSGRSTLYQTILAPRALTEAEAAYAYIARDSHRAAERWFADLLEAVECLSRFPQRCPPAPEDERFRIGLRHLILGNYRILFTIDEVSKTVHVPLIRHGARRLPEPEEFK